MQKLVRIFLVLVCWLSLLLWIIGQIGRDSNAMVALLFYIPSVAVLIALFTAWVIHVRTGNRIAARLTIAALLVPTYVVFHLENQWWRPKESVTQSSSSVLRLVHWNVASGNFRWTSAARQLVDQKADVYVLSEVPSQHQVEAWMEQLGTPYDLQRFGPMAIAVRGTITEHDCLHDERDNIVYRVEIELSQSSLTLFIVDIYASPRSNPRNPVLQQLVQLIIDHSPHIVVGDLNAPRRSLALSRLPNGYRHAYHSAGAGWGYTWPVPLPVYSLDQCIHSGGVNPVNYDLRTTFCSDHRLQRFDFRISGQTLGDHGSRP